MITIREIQHNPCREIIEGRVKLRTVRTVPYLPTKLQPAPAPAASQNEPRFFSRSYRLGSNYHDLDAYIETFRTHIGGGDFTSKDVASFFVTLGWTSKNSLSNASAKIAKLFRSGEVIKTGRSGNSILYQFSVNP